MHRLSCSVDGYSAVFTYNAVSLRAWKHISYITKFETPLRPIYKAAWVILLQPAGYVLPLLKSTARHTLYTRIWSSTDVLITEEWEWIMGNSLEWNVRWSVPTSRAARFLLKCESRFSSMGIEIKVLSLFIAKKKKVLSFIIMCWT